MEPNFSIFFLLISLYFSSLPNIEALGFSIDLIHRDSPLSPLYNPSNTHFVNLRNAFRRSKSRSPGTIQAPVTSIPGEYLMNISIGTPPVTIVAIADTGSDITWTQCNPCPNCFKQNFPLFNPQSSSTYKNLPCLSELCQALESSSCSKNSCKYRATYGDQSYSNGDLAVDTFTFGSSSKLPVSIPDVGFGCGHDDGGNFNELTSGIVGLGGGPLSVVSQLSEKIDGKFSYCLIPISKGSNVSSTISFGSNAIITGPGVVSTPLVYKDPVTYYYLTLDSVSVGDTNLKFKTNSISDADLKAEEQDGNIIIDSGTTLTLLPSGFYDKFLQEVSNAISATSIADPEGHFNLCYKDEGGFELLVPTITFHFRGADLNLRPSNTFLEVEKGVVCLVINPSDQLAIFGNLSQMDFLIGYDLVNKKVSFKPVDCEAVEDSVFDLA